MKPPKSVEVGLDLKFIKISGTLLAVACGIPDLSAAMPEPPAGS